MGPQDYTQTGGIIWYLDYAAAGKSKVYPIDPYRHGL